MIEAISVANAEDLQTERRDSLFGETVYKSPLIRQSRNLPDLDNKDSPYYIR